jgi:hypothetical protein
MRKTRRLLRAMEPEMRDQIADAMQSALPAAIAAVRQEAPRRTGALANAISGKVLRKSLTMRLGLLTKKVQRDYFYGYILEVGRKAKTVNVRRKTASGISTYRLNVRPMSPARYDMVASRGRKRVSRSLDFVLKNAYRKALTKLAGLSDA